MKLILMFFSIYLKWPISPFCLQARRLSNKKPASWSYTWRLMETHGDSWRLMETHGDSWRLMETHGDS